MTDRLEIDEHGGTWRVGPNGRLPVDLSREREPAAWPPASDDEDRIMVAALADPDALPHWAHPESAGSALSLRATLARLGISRSDLARLVGVDPGVMQGWMDGDGIPPNPVIRLIRLIEADPEGAQRTLAVAE